MFQLDHHTHVYWEISGHLLSYQNKNPDFKKETDNHNGCYGHYLGRLKPTFLLDLQTNEKYTQ